jgi:L-ornithine N5-oxygenase
MPEGRAAEFDTVVVGFGPAGIAFTCAVSDWIEETGQNPVGRFICLEKAETCSWHGEFLVRNADINHHVFRDLVTPRNPRSRFSFAMYLKARERLYRFGLLGRPPSRHEWSDYLAWAASQLSEYVSYGEPVLFLAPVVERGELVGVTVSTQKGEYVARNVVLSSGSIPKIPDLFVPHLGRQVFHTSTYLSRIHAFGDALPRRWLILGSGQSAGEAALDLLGRGEDVTVESVHRSIGFRIGQLGQFPNLAFLPEQVDYFHGLDHAGRARMFAEIRSTNYAGVDVDDSQALYSRIYEDSIEGKERLRMWPFSEVESVTARDGAYEVVLRDVFTSRCRPLVVDAVVLGTGYEQPRIPPLLADFLPWLQLDEDSGITVDRDYRIVLKPPARVAIFANGLSERAHGISDAQSFSLVALRAERILASLLEGGAAGRAAGGALLETYR